MVAIAQRRVGGLLLSIGVGLLIAPARTQPAPLKTSRPQVVAGGQYSFLVVPGRRLWGWGDNEFGQLGNRPTRPADPIQPEPALVPGTMEPVQVEAGWRHTVALDQDGRVWSWGANGRGELGDGTTKTARLPVRVLDERGKGHLTGICVVVAGSGHSLAIRQSDGAVLAWGNNGHGQLGNGAADLQAHPIPTCVPGLADVVALAAGEGHSLALTRDGAVWTWGRNDLGQLGDGTRTDRLRPTRVVGLPPLRALAAGWFHSLAVATDGRVFAWGHNASGQLGDGTDIDRLRPIAPLGLVGIVAVSGGHLHSLALHADGTVWGWGGNYRGQVGDGTTIGRLAPVRTAIRDAYAISAGYVHSLAICADGSTLAWGDNDHGQLGASGVSPQPTPVQIAREIPDGGNGTSTRLHLLSPEEDARVAGDEVVLRFAVLSVEPIERIRVWIGDRPFGPTQGVLLPTSTPRGRLLEKGWYLEGDTPLTDRADRDGWVRLLPGDVRTDLRVPRFPHQYRLRLRLPLEDTDGARIAVTIAADAAGIRVASRTLRLHRPQAQTVRGDLHVLAIGVGRYRGLPPLAFAARDALRLARSLQKQGGEGRLYRRVVSRTLLDTDATLPAIRQALADLAARVRPGDTALLLLSGHGLREGARRYFASQETNPDALAKSALPWDEVIQRMRALQPTARTVWVLADCCRAGTGLNPARRLRPPDLRQGLSATGNLLVCTASSGDGPSYESPELGHGIFTHAWIEAIEGRAPEVVYEPVAHGRVLTLAGLQFAVSRSVKQRAREAGVRQQVAFPHVEGPISPSLPLFMPPPGDSDDANDATGGR